MLTLFTYIFWQVGINFIEIRFCDTLVVILSSKHHHYHSLSKISTDNGDSEAHVEGDIEGDIAVDLPPSITLPPSVTTKLSSEAERVSTRTEDLLTQGNKCTIMP
jgi:hypothetical protein